LASRNNPLKDLLFPANLLKALPPPKADEGGVLCGVVEVASWLDGEPNEGWPNTDR